MRLFHWRLSHNRFYHPLPMGLIPQEYALQEGCCGSLFHRIFYRRVHISRKVRTLPNVRRTAVRDADEESFFHCFRKCLSAVGCPTGGHDLPLCDGCPYAFFVLTTSAICEPSKLFDATLGCLHRSHSMLGLRFVLDSAGQDDLVPVRQAVAPLEPTHARLERRTCALRLPLGLSSRFPSPNQEPQVEVKSLTAYTPLRRTSSLTGLLIHQGRLTKSETCGNGRHS